MRRLPFTILFIIFLFLLHAAQAQQISGGEFEYRFTGKDTLKVTLKIYRNCKTFSSSLASTQTCVLKKSGCSTQDTAAFTVTKVAATPVKLTCSTRNNYCQGDSFPYGIEQNIYEATVYLNSLFNGLDSSCCWYSLSFTQCCRDSSITNISPGTPFYIYADINRCIFPYTNSSPQTTLPPLTITCAGQALRYNNGFLDSLDHDSVSVEFENPAGATYANGFSLFNPFNFLGFPNYQLPFPAGINLNNINGDLSFVPMGQQQAVVAFKATEWRKVNGVYQKIGAVRRESFFYTIQCAPNNPPELEINGGKAGPFSFIACAGSTLCLTIKATDKDTTSGKSDTTLLSWNSGISGSTFSRVNSAGKIKRWDSAQFCWTPQAHHASTLPYYFVVQASDDNCPVSGISARAIAIVVRNNVSTYQPVITKLNALTFCLKAKRTDSIYGTASVLQWSIYKIPGNTTVASSLNGDSVVYTFDSSGTYVVKLRCSLSFCERIYYDTIRINCQMAAQLTPLQNQAVCKGTSFQLALHTGNANGFPSFQWQIKREGSTVGKTLNTIDSLINYTADSTGIFIISARAKDSTCSKTDSLKIYVAPVPIADFSASPRNGIAPLQVNFTNGSSGKFNRQQWSFGDTALNPSHIFTASGYHQIWLKVTNTDSAVSCSDSLNKPYFILVQPACTIKPLLNEHQIFECLHEPVQLSTSINGAQGAIKYRWVFTDLSSGIASVLDSLNSAVGFTPATTGTKRIVISVSDSVCTQNDTALVAIYPVPVASFTASPTSGNAPLHVLLSYTGTFASHFIWSTGDTTSNVNFTYTNPGSYNVWVKAWRNDTLSLQCSDSVFKANYILAGVNSLAHFNKADFAGKIYPNPTKGAFTIELSKAGNFMVTISDYTGRKIEQLVFDGAKTTINSTDLAAGIYLVTIHSEQYGTVHSKVVIK
ncbi:MAG: T9SS type A sorting domain-containing protein [Bacteroidia bacterium]|nr:T9SS type A sorting domain-containing protein [Bacteroidia bacterium]